ncbi:Pre-mRNA-splicing factor sap61 [Savitreella phatthalungensis]
MEETVLEKQRYALEHVERLETAIADRLLVRPRTVRDRLQLDHELHEMTLRISEQMRNLKRAYADDATDEATATGIKVLKREQDKLSLAKRGADALDDFYGAIQAIKTHYRRFPDEQVEDLQNILELDLPAPTQDGLSYGGDADAADDDNDKDVYMTLFSPDEGFGRYIDLQAHYKQFVNLLGVEPGTYARYVETFDKLDLIPESTRKLPSYAQYIRDLAEYLVGFWQRLAPLERGDVQAKRIKLHPPSNTRATQTTPSPDDASVWCDACQKSFAKRTVYDGHLTGKKHKAAVLRRGPTSDVGGDEAVVCEVGRRMRGIAIATRDNIVRKQTLTEREWLAERDNAAALARPPPIDNPAIKRTVYAGNDTTHQEIELGPFEDPDAGFLNPASDDDNDDDASRPRGGPKANNPLNFPLGWDGKPIPAWLFRLHGLGHEFGCEVCGGHVYMGRRAFDRHFREPRHLQGLSFLGIAVADETVHTLYHHVTSIDHALALKRQQQAKEHQARRKKEHQVEMEDDRGNVMSERVYKDLVAQGIL